MKSLARLLFYCVPFVAIAAQGPRLCGELVLRATFDVGTIVGDELLDLSGNDFRGLIQGGDVQSVPGVAGEAMEFLGSDLDYVDFDLEEAFDPGGNDFSVSVWFDADPAGAAEFVVSKGNPFSGGAGWSIWMENGSVFTRGQQLDATNDDRFGMNQPNVEAGPHHVVLVLDRTEDRIFGYLDGQLMENAGGGGAQTDVLVPDSEIFVDDPLLVGRRSTDGAPLTGWVDDLQIYRQALSEDDVVFLFEHPGVTLGEGNPFDYNGDGVIDVADVDLLRAEIKAGSNQLTFDVNEDGQVSLDDLNQYVESPDILHTWIGDANLDGTFDSSDLVDLLAQGQYEDAVAMNSTWGSGDFNADGEFDSGDLVAALSGGGYEQGPRAAVVAVPEPGCMVLLIGITASLGMFRRRTVYVPLSGCDYSE